MTAVLFKTFLLYILIEGAIGKWLWTGHSIELFALKDALLLSALACLVLFERDRLRSVVGAYTGGETMIWMTWIVIALVALVVSEFGLVSLVGLRYYLAPLPILILFPATFPTGNELFRFLQRYALLAIPICLLGVIQFISPADSLINSYSWSMASSSDVSTFGSVDASSSDLMFSYVRVTGTFSYISTFAAYLQFAVFLSLAMFLLAPTERQRLVFATTATLIFLNILMNGSRANFAITLVLSLPFFRFALPAIKQRYGAVLGVAAGLMMAGAALFLASDLFSALAQRNQYAGDAAERVFGSLLMPLHTISDGSLLGAGLGQSFLGLGEATSGRTVSEYIFDEIAHDRIAAELGTMCYLFFLGVKIYFLAATFALFLRSRALPMKVLALLTLAHQASLLWQIPVYNAVGNSFYFCSIALFCWLRQREATRAHQQSQVASPRVFPRREVM